MSALAIPFSTKPLDATTVDAHAIAETWTSAFNAALQVDGLEAASMQPLFVSGVAPWWQDHLALAWDIRTFNSFESILRLLQHAVAEKRLQPLNLTNATLIPIAENLLMVQASYTFESPVLSGSAIAQLVQDSDGAWKAWTVYTRMEEIKGAESDLNRLATPSAAVGDYVDVLIVGAGGSGLQVASALRTLGLQTLLVEQNARVGDHWRRHYNRLKLHLTKYFCQFGYIPWPESTSLFPTRDEVAAHLEYFVKAAHLDVVTSATVSYAQYDPAGRWNVTITRKDGTTQHIQAGHLVFSTGINGLNALTPTLPDRGAFHGATMHSSEFKSAVGWSGKRALIVGVGNSGHDIANDFYDAGANVTMIQRNPTMVTHQVLAVAFQGRMYNKDFPVQTADMIEKSTPVPVVGLLSAIPPPEVNQDVAAIEKGLVRAGFRMETPDPLSFIYARFGGHYLNTGTSKLIANGKIAIKSGVPIKSFTARGLEFADGTELPADVIVFATGFNIRSIREAALDVIGPEEGKNLKEAWGLNEEGNLRGAYRGSGHERLWYAGGDFQIARYFAKILALQIKAVELGVLNKYT